MEFSKTTLPSGSHYWTWRDIDFLPYAWLDEKDLPSLPKPFYLQDIHPNCPIGHPCTGEESKTNEIRLAKTFEELSIDPDLRKDLRRIEKKNESTTLIRDEPHALEKSSKWFLEQFNENQDDFKRRMHLWKEASTLSAYSGDELTAVHVTMQGEGVVYYLGCWWNREHKTSSPATYLLKKDIQQAIADGIETYDLGIGDEKYKKQWNPHERQTKYYAQMPKHLANELKLTNFKQT